MRAPIFIGGALSIPFRVMGFRRSRMNPNLCNLCETMFRRVKRTKQLALPLTVLCADVRGYTTMSETRTPAAVAGMLEVFYEQCGLAIWERDGIINKFIGDSVLALFNFPITRDDHLPAAVEAAMDLQRRCIEAKRRSAVGAAGDFGIGVGVHSGVTAVGEIGESCRDFTAIGPVVNLASRRQGAARPGEVLVTDTVYAAVADRFPNAEARTLELKGIEKPVQAYALQV
jgi:class 3 adenylate cyclase